MLQPQVPLTGRLLVVGAGGLLGGALHARWRQEKRDVIATGRRRLDGQGDTLLLDLSQPPDAWPALPSCRVAVFCAAVTKLEQCHRDPANTRKVNVDHTLALAQRLSQQGTFIVFLSTNLVFDGTKPLRHAEEPVAPQTEYGRQKADVETGLAALGMRHAIVRLTKVMHPSMPLLCNWVNSLQAGRPIVSYVDMVCAPVAMNTVLEGLALIAEKELEGTWQFSPKTDISYFGIATELARLVHADTGLVQPGSARQLATLEHLPAYTTLDSRPAREKLRLDFADPNLVIAQIFSLCQVTEHKQN